jgi:hypothetical protein
MSEGIPEDILATARYARRVSDEAVAHAILAERARCAAIADALHAIQLESGGTYRAGFFEAATIIADGIRAARQQ